MKDGIYRVKFTASSTGSGEGLVVIRQGSVNGADWGFTYQGHMHENGSDIEGTLQVLRYDSSSVSVFGPLDAFKLKLAGKVLADTSFRVAGIVLDDGGTVPPGMSISIDGKLIRDLV